MTAPATPHGRPLLVVIGAPGAGKTRIGKRIARALGAPFIDTDRRIVQRYGPIAGIFSTRGEEQFRAIERIEVAKALRESAVVSLGGGAVLDARTRADLDGLPVALMTVSAEAVAARIGVNRPLLKNGGVEAWRALVEERRATYESLATRSWDTSSRPVEAIASEIAHWVRTRRDDETRRTDETP